MNANLIDVWSVAAFDPPLLALLETNAQLIRDYFDTSQRQFAEREASDHRGPHPTNPFGRSYMDFVETIMRDMESRSIRAWHYTRLTDGEVENMKAGGLHPGTLETLRKRLDQQAGLGFFSKADADLLYAGSPCHNREQQPGRLGKFWMAAIPIAQDDSLVELLLESWGGESTYFWQEDQRLQVLLRTIGLPRIIEIAVNLSNTNHSYWAAKAVVETYARTLGCKTDRIGFDLYTVNSLPATSILAIHTQGDEKFDRVGLGYPQGFERLK